MVAIKKKWYSIVSPIFKNAVIGETLGHDQNLSNRKLDVNLMSITNDPRNQNTKILFRINSVKDDKAIADVIGYGLTLSYVRRLIRNDANKIVDSFVYTTKDDIKIVIKPFIITRYKTNKNILKNLRKTARSFLTEEIKKHNYDDLISLIVNNSIQKALREKLSKIYSLSSCEFRIVERV